MDLFAPRHLLVILLIVLVVFGSKKLTTIGTDLGAAVRGFKKAFQEPGSNEADAKPLQVQNSQAAATPAQTPSDAKSA